MVYKSGNREKGQLYLFANGESLKIPEISEQFEARVQGNETSTFATELFKHYKNSTARMVGILASREPTVEKEIVLYMLLQQSF